MYELFDCRLCDVVENFPDFPPPQDRPSKCVFKSKYLVFKYQSYNLNSLLFFFFFFFFEKELSFLNLFLKSFNL